MTRLLAAALGLCALLVPAGVAAQPDAQLRWPTLVPGELILVRGTGVTPHLETAIGLDLDVVRRPIVVDDPAVGIEHDVVETRVTSTLAYALGLFDHSQVTLAIPLAWMSGEGQAAITRDPRDDLPAAAAGDVRLGFQHALTPTWADLGELDLALSSGLTIPTGDETAFAGHAGFAGWVETAATGRLEVGRLGTLRLQGAVGARVRESTELAGATVGSELTFSAAVGLELLDRRVVLAAEGQALLGLRSGADSPVVALGEVRALLGESRSAELAFGAGAGLNEALGSPELQAVLQLRYVPRRANEEPP